ncbi:hypothetical protein [Arthrobacter sp.]|uniref:hypothetical protein n=1 Tax=Arthrobacter sp. TaxID=1667 RepID=UPI003A9197CA
MVDAPAPRRVAATAAAGLAIALVLSGCTASGPADPSAPGTTAAPASSADPAQVRLTAATTGIHPITGTGPDLALATSRALFAHAPAVVVLDDAEGGADSGAAHAAAERAQQLGVPLLLAPGSEKQARALDAELTRLGATTVIRYGAATDSDHTDAAPTDSAASAAASDQAAGPSFGAGVKVIDGADPQAAIPDVQAAAPGTARAAVTVKGSADAGTRAGLATARAAGAATHTMASADPRTDANRGFFRKHADAALYPIGQGFGPAREFAALAATAATGPELPGGGQIVFPDRRMVALYGTPGTASLGLLGEQGVDAAIRRARKQAAAYQPYSKEKVQPAFEIIATVASASAGQDGTYSTYVPVKKIETWVKAARKAGVYVVLDLQPGRNDFLTQARHYRQLLEYPNVGLAFDPEWRLKPGQKHMAQIGSVDASEINRTNDWLAELTRKNRLPQKVVILHQFQRRMISHREDLDTSHPELALVLHADGNGTPGQKLATWNNLRRDLPKGIRMAWKNFIDEDSPTFTPQQTYALDPKPWFVSYQ